MAIMTVTSGHRQSLWVSDTYRAMQTAIGWQLKMRYEPPTELPPKLIDLVAAMDRPREPGD
jgi:hypothetical protein